jgi:hypothetical protein
VSLNFSLVTLDIDSTDFPLYLTLAHRWAKDRPWAFAQSGGYSHLTTYLDKARRPDQKNIGVFVNGEMISLVTVEKEPNDVYLMHVTSPKRSNLDLIIKSTYTVGWQLFNNLNAQKIYTMSPRFRNRHLHRGSVALCEGCGLRATRHKETDSHGTEWLEYAMSREDWLENHHGKTQN